jgi:hypothetical protein
MKANNKKIQFQPMWGTSPVIATSHETNPILSIITSGIKEPLGYKMKQNISSRFHAVAITGTDME